MKLKRLLAVLLSVSLITATPMQTFAQGLTTLEVSDTVSDNASVPTESETEEALTEEESVVESETEEITETESVVEEKTEELETETEEVETEVEIEAETEEVETEITVEAETEEAVDTVTSGDVKEVVDVTSDSATTDTITVTDVNGCYSLTVKVYDDSVNTYAEVTGYTDLGQSSGYPVTIPATVEYNGEAVNITGIVKQTFEKAGKVNALHFEEGSQLTTIGVKAFLGCTLLSYVEFPDTLTTIGISAFSGCTLLGAKNKEGEEVETPELILPANLEVIGEAAFESCTSLEKAFVPKTLTTVKADGTTVPGPFYKCDNLTDITIEGGMTTIPAHLFEDRIVATTKDYQGNYEKTITFHIPDSVQAIGKRAFYKQVNMSAITFGENSQLVTIGEEAFSVCTLLPFIDFPETVTTIGVSAFSGCSLLGTKDAEGNVLEEPELVLPSRIEVLGESAFQDCDSLKKVTIPKTLTTIKADGTTVPGPFYLCDNLTDITIEAGMTTIPAHLFDGHIVSDEKDAEGNYIQTIEFTIPDTITTIGTMAFQNQYTMSGIHFGENSQLTKIGEDAFTGCTLLSYIDFPETVTTIDVRAFSGCTLLGTKDAEGNVLEEPTLVLPSRIEVLGETAFQDCDSLKKVTIPKTLTTIKADGISVPGPFYLCDNLTDITIEAGMTTIPAHLFDGHIVSDEKDAEGNYIQTIEFTIPDTITTIGTLAFQNQYNMSAIHFGENSQLTTIGKDAFTGCTLLSYIDFPETVTTIDVRAFSGCTLLGTKDAEGNILEEPELVLPSGLQVIGETAFQDCDSITKVTIPKTLTSVKAEGTGVPGPFYLCDNLTNITIEDGITTIPAHLFEGHIASDEKDAEGNYIKTLSFTIPDSVTSIGARAFVNQYNASEIKIGAGSQITQIGNEAFSNCALIKEIYLPSKLTSIGTSSFATCSSLESILVPETVTSIGKKAFEKCIGLKSVEFEVNNSYTKAQSLGTEVFQGCTSLETVKFGNKITTISDGTFSGCTALTELEIPYGVTTIGKNVFYNCNALKALFIPSSVTKISTTQSELAYCYEQGLKIYVEKGDSTAKTFAETNEFETEVGIYVTADEFPDVALLAQMNTQRYDRNLDTRLTIRELEQLVDVNLSGLGIKDMTGTQLFTSMESLDCSDNAITALNTESWTLLNKLNCSGNQLTVLDISKTPVESLDCSNNSILVFDFSAVDTLKEVTLGAQAGTLAIAYDETYKEYILPLKEAYASYNKTQISEISDEDTGKPNSEGLVWYEAYDVPDTLTYHYATAYGSGDSTAQAVVTVTIPNAGIEITAKEYPDSSFRAKINELVDTNDNGLISKTEERACKTLDVSNSEIENLTGIARLVNLTELNCKGNNLAAIDLSQNPKLEILDCRNNKLKAIDTSANTGLVKLLCDNNQLKTLDISANTLLEVLECGNNKLAAIDISTNIVLDTLRSGSQEIILVKETFDDKSYVKVKDYEAAYDATKVSNVIVYIADSADTTGNYVQITEDGFIVDSEVDKVTYEYAMSDFRKMNVALTLVDKLEGVEEIEKKDIGSLRIDTFSNKIYTGEATFQNIVIFDGTYMLRKDYDYTVAYADNIEVGTATVTIKGTGNYYGSYSGTYQVVPEWNITIKNIANQTFQNKELTPKLTVKLGNKSLKAGTDYEAEYLNNVDTGVATVVITGIGEYAEAGMKEATFNIVEYNIKKANFSISPVTYNGKEQEPAIKATHNGYLAVGKDFTATYSKNIKAGKGTVTISGIGNYTGTVKKTFVIEKINIGELSEEEIIVESQAEFSMTGAKAAVTVKKGDFVLTEGVDYTLSYSKNKAIGKAKVTIKGKGSCTGKTTKEFDVVPQSIDNPSVQIQVAVAQKDKNGNAVKPKITIIQNKKKLREGENKDYTFAYDEEATKNSGIVKVTITGHNKFKGTVEKEFVIVDQLINKAKVKGLQNWEYDGSEKEQSEEDISVMLGADEVPADCYELSYTNNTDVGNAFMTVTADPTACNYEYGGSVTVSYKIAAVKFKPSKSEDRVTASLQAEEYAYTGKAICPGEIVYDETRGVALTKDVDYTVSYKNNTKVNDKGSVTIKGIGNYTGTITLSFSVVPKNMAMNEDDFTVVVKNSAYTGKKITPRVIVKDEDVTLKLNKDYSLKIEAAGEKAGFDGTITDKGKYIITIEGIGNYTGQLENEYYLYVY